MPQLQEAAERMKTSSAERGVELSETDALEIVKVYATAEDLKIIVLGLQKEVAIFKDLVRKIYGEAELATLDGNPELAETILLQIRSCLVGNGWITDPNDDVLARLPITDN